MVKLLGFSNGTSKAGKPFTVMQVVKDYSDREKENGAVGCKVSQEFLPQSQVGLLQPKDIGRELSLDYDISGGRAYLVSVSFIK